MISENTIPTFSIPTSNDNIQLKLNIQKAMKWNDEYWPLLIHLYKKKPEGVKAIYSHGLIEIALNLHITPQELHRKMMELRKLDTPFMQQLWKEYKSTKKLSKAVKILEEKQGYGTAGKYFQDIETNESWELNFRPLDQEPLLMPVHLILILDLYFQLTPTTMVKDTEEIQKLAKKLKIQVTLILRVMEVFRFCDPYLNKETTISDPLLQPCKEVWNKFGNDDIEKLSVFAAQLKEYFK